MVPAKDQVIKKIGQVIEALPSATFKVKLEDDSEILAHLSGRMRLNHIRVLVGDRVVVEMTPYDSHRGRIVLRGFERS
ncbi:MAG: translation initiation factor IF-1 [Patescibacteria group bacterium]